MLQIEERTFVWMEMRGAERSICMLYAVFSVIICLCESIRLYAMYIIYVGVKLGGGILRDVLFVTDDTLGSCISHIYFVSGCLAEWSMGSIEYRRTQASINKQPRQANVSDGFLLLLLVLVFCC